MDHVISGSVSLADVARQAGVSRATASMALRSQGVVAVKTRELVKKVADELGYRPNLAASMLASQRERGALHDIPVAMLGMGMKSSSPFAATSFVREFLKHASQHGFLVEEPESEQAEYEQGGIPGLFHSLYYRGVRGIMLSHYVDTHLFAAEDVKHFSFLCFGNLSMENRFHRVASQVFESVQFLWEQMWRRGYRRIGAAVCRHNVEIPDDFAREAAVLNCQARHKAPRVPLYMGGHDDGDAFIQWVKEVRPDAVMGFSMAHYYTLLSAGFKLPQDMGFASLHIEDPELDQGVTGMHEDFDELGRIAVTQMDSMIRYGETGFPARPHETLVPFIFKEGTTLPPKRLEEKIFAKHSRVRR